MCEKHPCFLQSVFEFKYTLAHITEKEGMAKDGTHKVMEDGIDNMNKFFAIFLIKGIDK